METRVPSPILGFVAEFDVAESARPEQLDALRAAFFQLVGARRLECVGGCARPTWSHLLHSESSQATDADRMAIQEWAKSRREITAIRIGELFDIQSAV